jgi:hypothetical protein
MRNQEIFAAGVSEMGNWKVLCILVQKSEPAYRWDRRLKFGRLVEGSLKQKERIRNPDIFLLGGQKSGMENAIFFLIWVNV